MRPTPALLLLLAACVQPLPPPPRTAESPLAAVAEVRTIAFRAVVDRRQTRAQCQIVGPGYRIEVTTPSGVELPIGPNGAPDATQIRCTRGADEVQGGAIPADATMVFAVFTPGDAGVVYGK